MVGGRGRLIETFIIILSSRKGVDDDCDDDGRESYEVKREKELFIIIIIINAMCTATVGYMQQTSNYGLRRKDDKEGRMYGIPAHYL